MIHEAKAIRIAALLDEAHRKKHPSPADGCEHCRFLEEQQGDEQVHADDDAGEK